MERMKRRKLSTSDSSGEQERSTSRQTSEGGTSTSKRERFWENQRTNNRSLFTQGVERGILEKLRKRECISAPPSSSIGAIRRMCIDVYPSRAAVAKKIPEFHIRSFTPDGRFLVCFSLDLRSVVLYRYCMPDHAIPKTGSVTFETFFKKMFELQVAPEGETLCKTFSLVTHQGEFMILGTSTKTMVQSSAEKTPTFDRVALHVIDLERGIKCDEVDFSKDFIWLTQNNGISLYEDTVAVLSMKKQAIHFFHLNSIGKLVKVRSIGEFIYEDDERMLEAHDREAYGKERRERSQGLPGRGRGQAGGALPGSGNNEEEGMMEGSAATDNRSSNTEAQPYSGIKQRLLGYLVTKALKRGEKPGENEVLKRFFFHFKDYHSLLMWKMQLLDGSHLLIKFDKSPFLGTNESQSVQARYSGVFNIQSGKFICFFLDKNEELAYLYENFTDFFRMANSNHMWSRFVSSYSNDPFLRAQLNKQRDRYTKIYGSELELSKHISSLLPLSPQMTNSSPYLDARLFQFDDRFVSPYNCPKPVAEHAVKFLTRGLHSATRFKIDPYPASDEEEERDNDNYVTYVFHPVYPFAISCICNPGSPAPKVMKFYFR